MFYSITGKVTRVDDNVAVVEAGGVGYEVICSLATLDEIAGQNRTVYTYLQVREDGVSLFGFASLEEKRMFLNLISISGIGPKMAIMVLSSLSPKLLAGAIINGQVGMLTKVKGLGKKTAERIVLELKEKVNETIKNADGDAMDGFEKVNFVDFTNEMADAVEVLMELGIKKEEATKLVKAKAEKGDKTEEIVRKCL